MTKTVPSPAPIALTIAGSDSSGGAGVQADMKTFSALGVYGASVIVALTAQNTRTVSAVQVVSSDMIRAQIDAVLDDLDVAAIKIGMLANAAVIEAAHGALERYDGPVVLDPVMISKSGHRLLDDCAIQCLKERLLPRATLLTPNLPEAAALLDHPVASTDAEVLRQGHALSQLGTTSVLMKGGHADGNECTDWLIDVSAETTSFHAPRIHTRNTHGTGCTLSAAIAAGFAKNLSLQDAVGEAHAYLHAAIRAADRLRVGNGHGPVHHFHATWPA